jgi:hypothetical protein
MKRYTLLLAYSDAHTIARLLRLPEHTQTLCMSQRVAERLVGFGYQGHCEVWRHLSPWRMVHTEATLALSRIQQNQNLGADQACDDWSHWLVSEACRDVYWALAVRRLIEVKRPSSIWLQEPQPDHPSTRDLHAITSALAAIGISFKRWPTEDHCP